MRHVTSQVYLMWLDSHDKGKHVRRLNIDLQTRRYENLAKCEIEIDTSKYDDIVANGFYSSYVYAALDDFAKDFKDKIAEATKDMNIPDDERIQRDAYLSQVKVPVFEVYGIDDSDVMAVTLYIRGVA